MPENLKSYQSALVVILPEELTHDIERIRQQYDKRYHRWMPHITLVFPFVDEELSEDELQGVLNKVRDVTSHTKPFELSFSSFGSFKHGQTSFTAFLEPCSMSEKALCSLVTRLAVELPEFTDSPSRRGGSFTPHLTLGQFRARQKLDEMADTHQFLVNSGVVSTLCASIVWVTRNGSNDRMRVRETFKFEGSLVES